MSGTAPRVFERVYTVHDWWDGPRHGVADFEGTPHAYRSIFREELGDWDPAGRFELSPIATEAMAAVLEDWEIWRRWEETHYSGTAPRGTHPALPEDRARHDELARVVETALTIGPAARRIAVGEFRPKRGAWHVLPTGRLELEVCWTPED